MLNTTGVLTIMDRGLTLNWEDGPTLHRLTAQVRYHTASSATAQVLRVNATTQHDQGDDEPPLAFTHGDKAIRVVWAWREFMRQDGAGAGMIPVPYAWAAQLSVTNVSDEDVYLDMLDVLRIDSAYLGQFNLGAPPGLWRCARELERGQLRSGIVWETWSQTTANVVGFTRTREFLAQPIVSNRSRPPALLVRADVLQTIVSSAPPSNEEGEPRAQAPGAAMPDATVLPTEIKLEVNGERFERFVARSRADGTLLAPQAALISAAFHIASGDGAAELRGLTL